MNNYAGKNREQMPDTVIDRWHQDQNTQEGKKKTNGSGEVGEMIKAPEPVFWKERGKEMKEQYTQHQDLDDNS